MCIGVQECKVNVAAPFAASFLNWTVASAASHDHSPINGHVSTRRWRVQAWYATPAQPLVGSGWSNYSNFTTGLVYLASWRGATWIQVPWEGRVKGCVAAP